MAILPVTQWGDKVLDKKAIPVKEITPEIINFVNDMFDTMYNANGVGLAANQAGSNKAIFTIDVSPMEGYEGIKPHVFINPKIVLRSDETDFHEEGCLSIPGLQADVERPSGIKVIYYDLEMKEHQLERDDFFARVIQHEYDHLQGVFFTDRVKDEIKKDIKKDLIDIKNRRIEVGYPISEKELKK